MSIVKQRLASEYSDLTKELWGFRHRIDFTRMSLAEAEAEIAHMRHLCDEYSDSRSFDEDMKDPKKRAAYLDRRNTAEKKKFQSALWDSLDNIKIGE